MIVLRPRLNSLYCRLTGEQQKPRLRFISEDRLAVTGQDAQSLAQAATCAFTYDGVLPASAHA